MKSTEKDIMMSRKKKDVNKKERCRVTHIERLREKRRRERIGEKKNERQKSRT